MPSVRRLRVAPRPADAAVGRSARSARRLGASAWLSINSTTAEAKSPINARFLVASGKWQQWAASALFTSATPATGVLRSREPGLSAGSLCQTRCVPAVPRPYALRQQNQPTLLGRNRGRERAKPSPSCQGRRSRSKNCVSRLMPEGRRPLFGGSGRKPKARSGSCRRRPEPPESHRWGEGGLAEGMHGRAERTHFSGPKDHNGCHHLHFVPPKCIILVCICIRSPHGRIKWNIST